MIQHTELYYREGSSDKVYKASITEESKDLFHVNFAYGRRGNSLATGRKTTKPLAYEQAKKIYDKLINEKLAKGYREDATPGSYVGRTVASGDTGIRPQLLNEIEEEELEYYITNDDWCAQEKFDGRRRLHLVKGGDIVATNRKGLSITVDPKVEAEILKTDMEGVFDGEDMGSHVMLFDALVMGLSYQERYKRLSSFNLGKSKTLKVVQTAWTTSEKRALYKQLVKDNAEGIVFKNIHAEYKPGRPNSGGDQLKFKFCATATCMVGRVSTTKRSVSLNVFDENLMPVNVGNVTVYPNQAIPQPGDVVEVKYLYYFPGGSLFQPVLLGSREDMEPDDCTLKQLKIKREEVEI